MFTDLLFYRFLKKYVRIIMREDVVFALIVLFKNKSNTYISLEA